MKEKKTDKLDLIKIKNICASEDTIKKIIEWEKILQIIYVTRDL